MRDPGGKSVPCTVQYATSGPLPRGTGNRQRSYHADSGPLDESQLTGSTADGRRLC
jgi:hypothetical protein